jgi:hypothetical protein
MMEISTFSQIDDQVCQRQIRPLADRIFNRLRGETRFGWIIAFFTARMRLQGLDQRIAGRAVCAQRSLGLRRVELDRIVGSEMPAGDFDAAFNPRHEHMRNHWVRIAELELSQAALPAVELIQVGNEYFVRDGHYRVSVARGLGSTSILAQVICIELVEPAHKRSDPAALRYAVNKNYGEID